MKMLSKTCLCVLLMGLTPGCSSCGEDEPEANNMAEQPFTPPDSTPRPRPSLGQADKPSEVIEVDFNDPDMEFPDLGFSVDPPDYGTPDMDFGLPPEPECCMVQFAIKDEDGQQDEVRVVLRGSIEPLAAGEPASWSNGVWSAMACVPPNYNGTYHYDFVYEAAGEEYTFRQINPHAPRDESFGTEFNIWVGGQSCAELDTSLYSATEAL